MALIELRDIRKIYDLGEVEVKALDGVSIDIGAGEYVSLIGQSGSGKSTLMNTLGCLDRPSSGSYVLEGEEVTDLSLDARARLRNRKFGFVFQSFNLLARTSALENVELPMLYSRGISAKQRRDRAKEVLDLVGLGDRMGHHPGQLSGGQQQRVAVARALVNEPRILMADEPTGNLDSKTSRDVIQLFRQLNEQNGITLILVTHDPEIARNASRNIILRDGRVLEDTAEAAKSADAETSAQSETSA